MEEVAVMVATLEACTSTSIRMVFLMKPAKIMKYVVLKLLMYVYNCMYVQPLAADVLYCDHKL